MRRLATAVCASALLLVAACGDTGTPGGGTDRDLDLEDVDPTTDTDGGVDAGSDEEPYQCVQVSPAPGGEFLVGDGGTVEVARDDAGLVLGEVTTAEGWDHEVAEESATRIEVRFTTTNDGQQDLALVVGDLAEVREDQDVVAEICTRIA